MYEWHSKWVEIWILWLIMYEWHMPGFWVQFMIIDDDEDHRFRVSKLQIPLDLTVILINISNWQSAIRPNEYQIPNPSCNTCSNTETLSRKEGSIVHLPAVFKSPYICLPNTEPRHTHSRYESMNEWCYRRRSSGKKGSPKNMHTPTNWMLLLLTA
jgi:hypothetical protein